MNMKSKLPLIIFTSLIIVACVVLIALVTFRFSSKELPQSPSIILPTPLPITVPIPTGKTIEVSGVTVKNPYISPVEIDPKGDSLMQKDPVYSLVYLKPFEEFIISITASPFEENRKKAEQAFLLRMGVTQEDACKLKVTITTPLSINPNEAGNKYPLSFCQ